MVDSYNKWITTTFTIALTAVFASSAISLYFYRKRLKEFDLKIQDLESSLNSSLEKCASERQGRIRAQQALRKALAEPKCDDLEQISYPMIPIGFAQSCFSTRNGTPRQPLLVTLARACLHFNLARVPPASLEGLAEYSHCWIIYVFHLNTDLDKLWKQPSRSKFKAKVRVPRLKGGRMGVFATRSPHRPCPIGLTVAKVEAIQGNMVLLSGVDLVDGTPILDIKPYLPYCDSIQRAVVPKWVMEDKLLAVRSISLTEGFSSSLADCWKTAEKKSLYASPEELQSLIKQVLSWDIRSVSQRNQPHDPLSKAENEVTCGSPASNINQNDEVSVNGDHDIAPNDDVKYHLILEAFDVSYRIDNNSNVVVEKVEISSGVSKGNQNRSNYLMWRDILETV